MKTKLFLSALLGCIFLFAACGGGGADIPKVKIGEQTWSATNLDVAKFRNGDAIPEATNAAEWKAAGEAKKPICCFLNYDAGNGAKYGRLYNWYAISDARGLIPKGWHIPSLAEWKILEIAVGNYQEDVAAKKLKALTGWKIDNYGKNGNGEGNLGFSAPAGGRGDQQGKFYEEGQSVYWWTSSFREINPEEVQTMGILNSPDIQILNCSKGHSNYVRCVKD